jgi:hypothetical protein
MARDDLAQSAFKRQRAEQGIIYIKVENREFGYN